MKKKGKLKIISWISTIAMILSIFNIPLVGYATNGTEEGTESDVSYSVYAEVLDENYDINETVVTAESGHSVTGNYFNDNDGVPYRVFRITGIDSEGENVVFSESNSIVVTSGGPRVAKVADGDGFDGTVDDASESVSVTPAGTSPCFCVYFMGNGGTNITVEIDGETLMTFPISVDLTTCDVCGEYTCICESGEEGDDDGICDYCGKSIEDECVCGSAEYCDVCGETIENCTCGTDEIDLDSFGIRVDDDYGYQNVYDDGVCIEGFKGEDITRQFEIYYNDIDNDAVPKGTITVSSSNTDVALITTYEQPVGENSAVDERTSPASIPSAGDCTTQYFDLICVGTGTSTISLSYTPEGGDTSLIKSFPVEVVCNASIESLDIKYTLAGDSGEYTETIYFEGADYASVTLRPYDSDKDVYITGSDIAGNKIEELVEFEDGRYSIWLSAKSSDGNESKTYYVVIKEPTNPFVEITYYHDGKEKVKPVYFDDDPRPGISLPYGYDSSKAVTAEVTHLDGTVSNHSVFWEDSSTGLIRFTSNVGGEEFTYNVDVWVQDPSNDNDCDIYIKAYDDEGGYRENYIDWQAASEGGTTVTIPYGFSDRVELYAVPYSEYASLEGFYLDGEQELGYILVSDGDTRTFDVIAQSGDRKTYKLTFVESDGTNADVDVSANIYDLNLENSDFGGYRDIDIEFSENNNVKTADVVLPYYYDNEYGIRLDFESDDSYSLAIDEEYKEWEGDRGYLSEDGTATVEYSITSPDGKTTKEYKINFRKETYEESANTDLSKFTVTYTDKNGEAVPVEIRGSDAADEDGAQIIIPADAFTEDMDEYNVDVYAAVAGNGYIANDDARYCSYNSSRDYNWLDYSIDLRYERSVELTFDVMPSNGEEIAEYKLVLVNGTRADDAEITEVQVNYTLADGETKKTDWLGFDQENHTGDLTLYPHDSSAPITITGTSANGDAINQIVSIENGVGNATITSTAYSGKTIEYDATIYAATEPMASVKYEANGYFEECEEPYDCYFNAENYAKVDLPYGEYEDDQLLVDIMLLDGTKIYPTITWREEDPDIGFATFSDGEETYTIEIEIADISSDTNVDMTLRAWDGKTYDKYGEEDYKYIYVDSEAAATEDGAIVVVPYGCGENSRLYADPYSYYASITGYDEVTGIPYSSVIKIGETRTYTVTAQDGSTQDYKVTFVESEGDSTAVELNDIDIDIIYNGKETGYYLYRNPVFEEVDGTMAVDIKLPILYDETRGVGLYLSSDEFVTYDTDFSQNIYPKASGETSFEFVVTSPNEKYQQKYAINFSLESEEDASKADLESMELSYIDENGAKVEKDVDLAKEENGNITIYVPENINFDEFVTIKTYSKGYAGITDSPTNLMSAGDWNMIMVSYFMSPDTIESYSFDVTSSDKTNVKTYTVTIKVGEEPHVCTWDEGSITKEPTCTEEGVKTYICECGETKTESVPVIDHTYAEVVTAPTCTEEGYTTYTCGCGDSYRSDYVVAAGHKMTTHAAIAAECEKAGNITYYTCDVCEGYFLDKEGKTATTAEQVVVPATKHDYNAVVTAPTCTEKGYTTYTCKNDPKHTYIADYVDATDHAYGKPEYTWGEDFSSVSAKRICANDANHIEKETASSTYEETAATCTAKGEGKYTAIFNNKAFIAQTKTIELPMLKHTEKAAVKENVVAATCTATGSYDSVVYCSVCSKELSREKITTDKIAHTEAIDAAVAATCTAAGLTEGKHCSVCNEVLVAQEVLAALGHKEVIDAKLPAKIGKAGKTAGKHCSVCKEVLIAQKTIPALVQPKAVAKTYNGKYQSVKVAVKDTAGKTITTISLPKGKNVGTYTKAVKLSGNYTGTVKVSYSINPKGTSISKLSKGKKSFTVKWKKQSGKMATSRINGYQIRYSMSSKMTGAKTTTVKGYSKTSKTIKKLKAKKTYYVQVRTYKAVKGVKYYSSWSKVKKVKTK